VAKRDDIAVVAISYDPVETLARFADEFEVTYPLLADEGSVEIERLGLLNVTIAAERLAWGRSGELPHRMRRLPYPGTFLLDEGGVVVGKKFERSYRLRPSGTGLIHDLMGKQASRVASGTDAAPGARATAWIDDETCFPGQRLYVHVRIHVDAGLHLYVPPLADGYAALRVTLGNVPGITVEPPEMPKGQALRVDGLPEEFFVVDGVVDVTVPFYFSEKAEGVSTLTVGVGYQACNESACFAPEELRIELPITHLSLPMP
jgi:hypothetical protein